jgi:DUF438 domain-containing protein
LATQEKQYLVTQRYRDGGVRRKVLTLQEIRAMWEIPPMDGSSVSIEDL